MTTPRPALAPGALGRGAALAAAARLIQVVLGFAMLAVVGRLVGAEAYGLFTLALLLVSVGDIVVGGGLTDSLVQREAVEPGHEDASFWALMGCGLLLAMGVAAGAAPLAALFAAPSLAALVPAVAPLLLLSALAAVPLARLQRGLRVGLVAGIETAAAIAGTLATIAMALLRFGVWSLVAGELVRGVVRAALLVALAGYRPGRAGRLSHLGDLLAFNASTLGLRALGVADRMLPRALIGALLGTQALGFFAVASRLYEQLHGVLVQPLTALALPVAARLQASPEALRALLRQAVRLSAALAFPAYLGLAAIAPLLVPLIMGPGWGPAVPVVQVMLLLGVRAAMNALNSGVLRGLGRPGLHLSTMAIGVGLTAVLVPLAAPFGLVAVTVAVALRRLLTWPITARQVERLTGFRVAEQLGLAAPSLLAAVLMAAAVLLLPRAFAVPPSAPELLLLSVLLGSALYAGLLALLAPRSTRAVLARLAQAAGRARGRVTQRLSAGRSG
jgi:PST family polysaccharide transporter